jgi:hypothetical protein
MNDLSNNLLKIENEKLKDEIKEVNEMKRQSDVSSHINILVLILII